MDINYLIEFLALVENKNYSEAADKLYISQSTLSKHIIALEKELNFVLFDRDTRHIQLSDYGQEFYKYAKKIVETYKDGINKIKKNMISDSIGPLRIGSIPVMPHYEISSTIGRFHGKYPDIKYELSVNDSANLIKALKTQEVDLAFIRFFDDIDSTIETLRYAEDELVAVFPKDHRLAKNDIIHISILRNEDFLFLHKNTSLFNICMKTCESGNFTPKIIYTGHRIENILDLIENGLGISLLMNKHIKYYENRNIKIVKLHPTTKSQILLCKLQRKTLNNYGKLFWEYVKSESFK